MKIVLMSLMLLILHSCSQRQALGTRDHVFGRKGKHVIWLQVAGLESEHLSFLKLDQDTTDEMIPFERMTCMGSLWSYNLYELRPSPNNGFLAQTLGSQKINGTCSDLDRKSVWSYFQDNGYEVGVFEGPSVLENSLLKLKSCEGDFNILKNSYLWSQSEGKGTFSTFHYQEATGVAIPGTYFDKSCHNGECFVPMKTNVTSLWQQFTKKNTKTFFTIRNFSFLEALKSKNTLKAKESLKEISDLINFFAKEAEKKSILLVVTSSGARGVELPTMGSKWSEYLKKGKHVIYRNSRLLNNVWSFGEGSENFCGIFEESDILRRFIWMPEKSILNLAF